MLRYDLNHFGTKKSDDYATPKNFFAQLNQEFQFNLDPCPIYCDFDGLEIPWRGNVYVNPPYSNIEPFIKKGIEELERGNAEVIVYLIPVRSDTRYWHELIMPRASEIRFVKGRLNFNESESPAPFPCALVVFRKTEQPLTVSSYFQEGLQDSVD